MQKIINLVLIFCLFAVQCLYFPAQQIKAQDISLLPTPGTMVNLTEPHAPATVMGLNIYPDNPLKFDFLVHPGNESTDQKAFDEESHKMIKYFLASLTVPEEEMWVNLSPYEKNRIIPESFGKTEMGRDLLMLDYMLKQLTASLIYPENELGHEFWEKVYAKLSEDYCSPENPVGTDSICESRELAANTFNKVWIVPSQATLYEHSKGAVIVDSHLKVMLEADYFALQQSLGTQQAVQDEHIALPANRRQKEEEIETSSAVSTEVIKEVIIPIIEKEVNQGKIFANLRQIYHAMLLASWYKNVLKQSVLGRVYVDQKKTVGLEVEDKNVKQKIYHQYVESFQKGVFDYIKEDYDPVTQNIIPRKYFSGGIKLQNNQDYALITEKQRAGSLGARSDLEEVAQRLDESVIFTIGLSGVGRTDTSEVSEQLTFDNPELVPANIPVSENLLIAPQKSVVDSQSQPDYAMITKRPERLTPPRWKIPNASLDDMFDMYMIVDPYLKRFIADEQFKEMIPAEIKSVLINDRSLRAVFLLKLDESEGDVGPLEDLDHETLDDIGGEALLNKYTGFLVGNAQTANQAKINGSTIIVGVTDRYSDKTLVPQYNVANRRQVFFPLFDGTWLGIEGAGDFNDEEGQTTFSMKNVNRGAGLVVKEEMDRTHKARDDLNHNDFLPVQYLGYRSLNVVTNGNGGLIPTSSVNWLANLGPILGFNRFFSVHRTVKLPQLLHDDPGLKKLFDNIATAFVNNGRDAPETVLEMIEDMVIQLAENSAFRHNNEFYKVSLHLQDFTFAGQEADNKELVDFKFMEKVLFEHRFENTPYYLEFFKKYKVVISDLGPILFLIEHLIEIFTDHPNKKFIGMKLLKNFFETYLAKLNDEKLKAWILEFDILALDEKRIIVSKPLQQFFVTRNFYKLHPSADSSENQKRDGFEVLLSMQAWLEQEVVNRGTLTLPAFDAKKAVSVDTFLEDGQYFWAGKSTPRKGEIAYGNRNYPAIDTITMEREFQRLMSWFPHMENLQINDTHKVYFLEYAQGKTSLEDTLAKFVSEENLKIKYLSNQYKKTKDILVTFRLAAKYNMNLDMETHQMISSFAINLKQISSLDATVEQKELLLTLIEEWENLQRWDTKVLLPKIKQKIYSLDLGENPDSLQAIDMAMIADKKGGIDLNPNIVSMRVNKYGRGLKLSASSPFFKNIDIQAGGVQGFVAEIIHKMPVTNVSAIIPSP